jgi:UPF0176 protein
MKLGVSAFYKFVRLEGLKDIRQHILQICAANGIRGTILLAPEGINGTIAGEPDALVSTMQAIRAMPQFANLESKESWAEHMPFRRMKVRLKKEIVTMGVPGVDPSRQVGSYVAPEDWNALISDPEVLVIDTRNSFEVKLGSFESAVNPGTRSFGEFPGFVARELLADKHRKIAMFCTGGIRCEKATSYLVQQGFTNVHHLKGGILKYLETVSPAESLWHGSCFVFDEREGLGPGLEITTANSGDVPKMNDS